jgi:type II secretory pathway pseudopilin PulG
MLILGTVLAALVGSFASAMNQEVGQVHRQQAYQNARLALQRMRLDIHCAGGVTSVDQNDGGGFTLTLTENYQGQSGWCPGVIPAGDVSVGVQWCTVPYGSPPSSTRFVLYRYLGLDPSDCAGSGTSTFEVDYVAAPLSGWPTNSKTTTPPTAWDGNIWPEPAACSVGSLPTVAIDLRVALDPVNKPNEDYELKDEIALRNANRYETC